MPRLTTNYPKSGSGIGLRESKWMERRKEGREGEPQRPNQPPADVQSQTLRTGLRWRRWHGSAVVVAVWSVCQQEAPLHPSLGPVEACGRLLLLCTLCAVLFAGARALKPCLRLGQAPGSPDPPCCCCCCFNRAPLVQPFPSEFKGEPPQGTRQELPAEHAHRLYSCLPRASPAGPGAPVALALTDCLLLCVLQEPLPDPSLLHIQALLCRLESVSHTLQRADVGSEARLEDADGWDGGAALTDKVKILSSYLQQRTRSLRRLVQAQGGFEAGVKGLLEGLDGLWAELEELHTRVTLSREGSPGSSDLAAARAEAQTLFVVLERYRSELQCCQAHLRDSTQLLQELTWSHTHISQAASSSESVWPELLLQTNIEQFDKVQESFLSLEQQTSTFQAHLEGLGGTSQEGHAGPLSDPEGPPCSCSAPPQTGHLADVTPSSSSSSSSTSVPALDADAALTLCERSALQLSTAIGRLRRSGRKK